MATNVPEFISIVRHIRDVIYPDVLAKQAAAAISATAASASASSSTISMWKSLASELSAHSTANEEIDVFVKTYVSNDDGTFTITDTDEYSAKHHQAYADNADAVMTMTNKFLDDKSNYIHANAIHFRIKPTTDLLPGDIIEAIGFDVENKATIVQKRNSNDTIAIGMIEHAVLADEIDLAIKDGLISGRDTSIYPENTVLFPNDDGGLSSIRQEGVSQPFAIVFSSHATEGVLFILVQQPLELPIQTGSANKYLKTDGTTVTWSDVVSSAGQGLSYFLGSNMDDAENYDLTTFPSPGAEVEVIQAASDSATAFPMERYITEELGGTLINGGLWVFNTYASVDSTAGLSEILINLNKSVAKAGVITSSGSGNTRTFTATESTFVAGDANADIVDASVIQTDEGTFYIDNYINDKVVEATSSNAGYVNETEVTFTMMYKLFGVSTGEINSVTPLLHETQTVEQEFVIDKEDKLVASYFAANDNPGDKLISLYKGGTENFTNIITPLVYRHDALSGLNDGDYQHLTVNEKDLLASGSESADTLHHHTSSGISEVAEYVVLGRNTAGAGNAEQLSTLPDVIMTAIDEALGTEYEGL